jgi:hypothetical protein
MFSEKDVSDMCELFIGREVDYCFHYKTPSDSRLRFLVRDVKIDKDHYALLVGEERMIQIAYFGICYGWIREGDQWVKEGSIYNYLGEELKIGGESWKTWFRNSYVTIRVPEGV